jgi:ribosome-binding protein aMBF1 (putative translation factor)
MMACRALQYRAIQFTIISEAASLWIETDHYRTVGRILAAVRWRAGLIQQKLAKQLGEPQSFVSQYENGQRRVDVVEFVAISDTLGIKAVDLFSEIANAIR